MGAAYKGGKKQFLGGGKRHLGYNKATEEKAQDKELKQMGEIVGSLYVEEKGGEQTVILCD